MIPIPDEAIAAAIKVIGDYIASQREPPEEVVRAYRRLEKIVDDGLARVQAIEVPNTNEEKQA